MILLAGIPSETPLEMVGTALDALGADYRFVNQRHVASAAIDWTSDETGVSGTLRMGDETIDLAAVTGAYMRLMDDRMLPELEGLAPDDPARTHSRAFHEALFRWSEVSSARVVNRAEPQGSNGSKPYQAQLIARHGLLPPPTLITNDPAAVLAFRAEHGTIIYKSISAVRSIVKTLDDDDMGRLERIGWCPVQFQAAVPGTNIRVHVIGDAVFPTWIESTHVDYRYAKRQGGSTELSAHELPEEIAARCVKLTADLGLAFAGIDLKLTPDGDYYCFEVNPSPAFSYFEANTGQPIAAAVARYLAGMDQARPKARRAAAGKKRKAAG
jgi:glutathione synthase/RimK-type ligase-like ATP-grasp enzyme